METEPKDRIINLAVLMTEITDHPSVHSNPGPRGTKFPLSRGEIFPFFGLGFFISRNCTIPSCQRKKTIKNYTFSSAILPIR